MALLSSIEIRKKGGRNKKKRGWEVVDNKVLMLCDPRLICAWPPWGRSQAGQPTAPHSCGHTHTHTHAPLITGALGYDGAVSRTSPRFLCKTASHYLLGTSTCWKGPPVSALRTTQLLKPLTDCCGQSKTLFIATFYFSESSQQKRATG